MLRLCRRGIAAHVSFLVRRGLLMLRTAAMDSPFIAYLRCSAKPPYIRFGNRMGTVRGGLLGNFAVFFDREPIIISDEDTVKRFLELFCKT